MIVPSFALSKNVNEYFYDILRDLMWPRAVTLLNDTMCLSCDQWYTRTLRSLQPDFQTYKADELAGCLQQMKGTLVVLPLYSVLIIWGDEKWRCACIRLKRQSRLRDWNHMNA